MAAGNRRDYYEVLGVDRSCDEAALKSAFRKIALHPHPDRIPDNKGVEEIYKEASQAYTVLSDPDKRAKYDRFGHGGFEGVSGGFPGGNPNDIFGEIFGEFFGRGMAGRGGRGRGADLRYNLELKFEEAAFGCEVQVKL